MKKRFRITITLERPDWDAVTVAAWLREIMKPEVVEIEIIEPEPKL